jgi:NAD+ kinase
MIKTVSINFHPRDRGTLPLIGDIITFLAEQGVRSQLPSYDILVHEGMDGHIADEEAYIGCADMVIAVGGDGTFLRTARLFADAGKPIFGINRGRLGFLTEFGPEEYHHHLLNILRGYYVTTERITLEAKIFSDNNQKAGLCFINDAVITKGSLSRAITVEIDIDGHFLNSYSGDGLIIATPTGSTAYSLSAGGPIITPTSSDVLCLTPVCPHTLGMRPMIVPVSSTLRARVITEERNLILTIDGQEAIHIGPEDEIVFSKSTKKINVVMHPDKNFYSILREKLGWG